MTQTFTTSSSKSAKPTSTTELTARLDIPVARWRWQALVGALGFQHAWRAAILAWGVTGIVAVPLLTAVWQADGRLLLAVMVTLLVGLLLVRRAFIWHWQGNFVRLACLPDARWLLLEKDAAIDSEAAQEAVLQGYVSTGWLTLLQFSLEKDAYRVCVFAWQLPPATYHRLRVRLKYWREPTPK